MIVSIGVDIIEVRRVRETIERTPRFAARVFTAAERAYCESRGAVAAQHYAARFAAKEAALKALQTGWSGGELYDETGATAAHLSIAHTTEHAIAEVILEKI
ncbi:MAG: 4-phosphopantetheinyl transferase [Acidobacteria bacterium]|nr:MAG: 4-phosphopantetheinyl transferase [Acidobacteriota bacterium]